MNITENRVQTPKNEIYTKEPKSKAGIRSIVMPSSLFEYLKTEHDRLKLLDKTFSENDYIVHMNCSKEPYRPDVFSQKFKRFLERHHLKQIRLHDLRHTCATMMLTAGVTPKVAQQILGHSEISTTMDTYSHVLKKVEIDAAEKIDKQIFGK
jgi:integrase